MTAIITTLRSGVPAVLEELTQLGRTLWRRRTDVLAYFDYHASNGPTEAINGRLEALRRNALRFRNLTHYRICSLLHCGNAPTDRCTLIPEKPVFLADYLLQDCNVVSGTAKIFAILVVIPNWH